jgi:V/A-type H+-transporting ATPase subunit B
VAIVGKAALSDRDKKLLEFADVFEDRFVRQGRYEDRNILETLELGWELLASLPEATLTRIERKLIQKYHPAHRGKASAEPVEGKPAAPAPAAAPAAKPAK